MRTLFVLGLLALSWPAFSQRSKLETVEIGIDQKALSAVEWPFDLPFYLTGAIGGEVQSVRFNYRIADPSTREKGWISFPRPEETDAQTGYLATPKQWKRGVGDNSKFVFLCDGLHPNIKYHFQFELLKTVSLDDKSVAEMKTKLANRLKTFFQSKAAAQITPRELVAENTALKAIVQSYFPGKDLRFKTNPSQPFAFDAFDIANASATQAFIGSTNLYTAITNYNDAVDDLVREFGLIQPRVLAELDTLKGRELKFQGYTRELLPLPFNPGLKEFKAYTLRDGLKLLRQMSLRPAHTLEPLLKGQASITNNDITIGADTRHVEGILFTTSLLKELGSGIIRDTLAGHERIFFSYFPATLKTAITEVTRYVNDIVLAQQQLQKVEASLPEILSLVVQFEALESEVLPVVDVVSEKTPYISAEAGIGYSRTFTTALHYRGANIYFTPIDKRAPLSSFKGWNRVLKSLSVQVGASNFFGDRAVNTQSLLGKSAKADLNLALGWRLNRVFKLNAGVVPYKTNNNNELSDKYEVQGAGYISLGIDVNLLKALGDVAGLLSF